VVIRPSGLEDGWGQFNVTICFDENPEYPVFNGAARRRKNWYKYAPAGSAVFSGLVEAMKTR
jgi:hypothetical protein